jgi:S-DNA-T family DNA segregation ATPase FtsK/SpoIIIE
LGLDPEPSALPEPIDLDAHRARRDDQADSDPAEKAGALVPLSLGEVERMDTAYEVRAEGVGTNPPPDQGNPGSPHDQPDRPRPRAEVRAWL